MKTNSSYGTGDISIFEMEINELQSSFKSGSRYLRDTYYHNQFITLVEQ